MKFWSKLISWVLIAWAVVLPQIQMASAANYDTIAAATVSTSVNYWASNSIEDFYWNLNWRTNVTNSYRVDMWSFINDKFTSDINSELVVQWQTETSVKQMWESLIHKLFWNKSTLSQKLMNAKNISQKRAILNNASIYLSATFHSSVKANSQKDFTDEAKWYLYAFQIIENYAKEQWITAADWSELTVLWMLNSNKVIRQRMINWKFITPYKIFKNFQWNQTTTNPVTNWNYNNNNNHTNIGWTKIDNNRIEFERQEAIKWLNKNNWVYSTYSELWQAASREFWDWNSIAAKIVELVSSWQFKYTYKVVSSNNNSSGWEVSSDDEWLMSWSELANRKMYIYIKETVDSSREEWASDELILKWFIKWYWKDSLYYKNALKYMETWSF